MCLPIIKHQSFIKVCDAKKNQIMTKLSELNIIEIERNGKWNEKDPEITGIETNSTRVEKGNIFLAKEGATKNSHGVLFSNQAIERLSLIHI